MKEEQVALPGSGSGDVPLSVWEPDRGARGVVLLGHGLGVDRSHATVREPVRVLVESHDRAVVAPDLPLHGARRSGSDAPAEGVDRWQSFWAHGGVDSLAREWRDILAYARDRFPGLPVAYFGLSLGTQYGLVFLSQASDIRAAVLGLFGSRPPPRTPVMNACAPRVRCPVYFIQKQEDEIHPLETSRHLFSILGSTAKILDSSPGRHAEVSKASLDKACAFVAGYD